MHAFDVQEAALDSTRQRLDGAGIDAGRVTLYLRDHADMLSSLPDGAAGRVAAVMFNLGYLPGGDHAVITRRDSTLQALDAAVRLLRPGGVVAVVVYPGHEGGGDEAAAVDEWAGSLPQAEYQALSYKFLNQRNAPPYVVAIEKR